MCSSDLPEGGHFRETWRDHPRADRARGAGKESPLRGAGTAILFLLARGERSHWHRVDASELWVWQAGASLDLRIHGTDDVALGPDLGAGQSPQGLVPPGAWQSAESRGAWTLVTCVVGPAFEFEGFELAPPGWSPV